MCSKSVSLLQFLFVCACVVSYVAFVLSLFVPRFSFFWCLRMVVRLIVAFPGYLYFFVTDCIKAGDSNVLADLSKLILCAQPSFCIYINNGICATIQSKKVNSWSDTIKSTSKS